MEKRSFDDANPDLYEQFIQCVYSSMYGLADQQIERHTNYFLEVPNICTANCSVEIIQALHHFLFSTNYKIYISRVLFTFKSIFG